jgi:outer membrane protein, heavy metal efflux system
MKFRRLLLPIVILLFLGQLPSQVPAQVATSVPDRPGALTLAQALTRVFERNPQLVVSELEIQAASARVSQAGVKPNPEIEAGAENISFPGIGSGMFQFTETTFQISQRLELGGKRDLRIQAAEKEVTVAATQLEVRKADLMTATSQAFADVLAEFQHAANQHELSRLAEQSYSIVVERVAAGKVSPIEQTRASVVLASAKLEEEKHLHALVAAKDKLASLWGGSYKEIDSVAGAFEIPAVSPEISEACMKDNPEIKMASAAIGAREAVLDLEVANRKPDLTFSAGFRRLNAENRQVLVAGVSIPLPLFDKRLGAIAEARARLDQSRAEQRSAEWRLRAALTQARHEHDTALLEATALNRDALPAAKEAASAMEEGYRLGKFDFINVLDAQRTYAELQGRYIAAVASGMKAAIEIERLARCDSAQSRQNPGK